MGDAPGQANADGSATIADTAENSLDPNERQARALFLEGIELAREERWDDAADAFKRSRDLSDRASTAFNHGSTLYRLGRFVEAQAAFDAYKQMAHADDPLRSEGLRLAGVLAEAIPTLTLELVPAHARVQIDGRDRRETGGRRVLKLDPGVHKLAVSADGHRTRELLADLKEGSRVTQVIHLERLPKRAPPAAVMGTRDVEDDGGSVFASPWFWLATAAVIGGGVATTFLLTQADRVGEVDKGTTDVLLVSLTQ